ncbi:MAG: abortive phage infection protein [Clostridiales bacterium]|nr:abortive phage infection protein [Clostridiales bacterium]
MQKDYDFLISVTKKNNGVIKYSDVEKVGISKEIFFRFVKNNGFERAYHGIYTSPDFFSDEMYLLQMRFPKIVFSHETALYLHSLSEMEPNPYSVTVPNGYNSVNLDKMGINIIHCTNKFYDIGLSDIASNYGNMLRVYDKERTICDIIRKRKTIDISVFNYSVREYAKSGDKRLNTLMNYAKKMNIEKSVRNTLEILL